MLAANPSALQSLFFRERSEDSKYDWYAGVQLNAHERVRDAFADILEVHGRPLDEDSDCNHRVEGSVVRACSCCAMDGRARA